MTIAVVCGEAKGVLIGLVPLNSFDERAGTQDHTNSDHYSHDDIDVTYISRSCSTAGRTYHHTPVLQVR